MLQNYTESVGKLFNTPLTLLFLENTEEKKRDILSHYFLRIAYCRNKDLRDWFVRQENFIFRARLDDLKNLNASRSAELLVKELEKLKAKHGEKLCPVERVFHTPQKENKELKRVEAYYRSYIEEAELDLSRGLLRVFLLFYPFSQSPGSFRVCPQAC